MPVLGESVNSVEYTQKTLQCMAEVRVREVLRTLNAFPEIQYGVALFDALRALWAEWILLGVPGDLLDEFLYEFKLVEFIDNSTIVQATNVPFSEWRDLAIEVTIVMSIDTAFNAKSGQCIWPEYSVDDDVVRHSGPMRAVFMVRPAHIPRGNGRYIWMSTDEFPVWEGPVYAPP